MDCRQIVEKERHRGCHFGLVWWPPSKIKMSIEPIECSSNKHCYATKPLKPPRFKQLYIYPHKVDRQTFLGRYQIKSRLQIQHLVGATYFLSKKEVAKRTVLARVVLGFRDRPVFFSSNCSHPRRLWPGRCPPNPRGARQTLPGGRGVVPGAFSSGSERTI